MLKVTAVQHIACRSLTIFRFEFTILMMNMNSVSLGAIINFNNKVS